MTYQVETWRHRLVDLSWLMRAISNPIAKAANREDHCKGRFWEGRVKSQALLDERALITCKTHIDLNPIRAGMTSLSENSDFTSVKARIEQRDALLLPIAMDTLHRDPGSFPGSNPINITNNDSLELVH